MNQNFFLAILLAALGPLRAAAAELPLLTVKDAEATALKNHPRITAAELESLASQQTIREARAPFFPIVSANATAVGTSEDNTRIAAGGLNNPLILERNAEGVSVSQLITDFGRTSRLTASSKLHAQAEEAGALATRADILLQVDAAYYDTLQARSVLEVAHQTVATRQLIFDQISSKATNGLRSGLDVSFARVDLDESKLLVSSAENTLQASAARLANLLGERDYKKWRLADESPGTNAPIPNDTQLVAEALENRPDLQRLRFEHDAASKFASAEHALHYPTVSAIGAAGIMPIHDPALRPNYAAAGVNLSVPIFDGFLFSAREKEAQFRAQAAAENLRDAENNVIRDVRVAALNLAYAAERLELTAKLLESANEAFELAQGRYDVGSSTIVELSQSQLNKTSAQIAQARARYEYQVRAAVLRYQTGRSR